MDQAKVLDLKKALSDNKNVVILLPEYINSDTLSTAAALYSFVKRTLNKNVELVSSHKIPTRFSPIVNSLNLSKESIKSELKPLQYIISLKDIEKELEVNIDKTENAVNIILEPKNIDIDITKLTVNSQGSINDLFITINALSLSDLGEIYSKNIKSFSNKNIFAINSDHASDFTQSSIYQPDFSTASETLYEMLKIFGASLDSQIMDVLLEGIVEGTDGLHRIKSTHSFETVLRLSSSESLPQKLKDLFYGYSIEGLELRKKIFSNIKRQQNVIYSTLSKDDLSELGIEGHQIDGIDFLPFGIVEEVEMYILSYDVEDGRKILIETKNKENLFNNLKTKGLEVTRSNNLICVLTQDTIENTLEVILGNGTKQPQMFPDQSEKKTEQSVQQPQSKITVEPQTETNTDNKLQNNQNSQNTQNSRTYINSDSPFTQSNNEKQDNNSPFKPA